MLPLLVSLTLPAWALDTEPNDSVTTAEPILGALTAQYGELSTSTDEDWYRITVRAQTDLSFWLERWAVAADNDFDLDVYADCGTTVSATSTGGSRRLLQYSAAAGEEVCIRVFANSYDTAGPGRYMLSMTREVQPPTVDGISPLDGDGEPYGAPGDIITITGSNFDAAPPAISVHFEDADGTVISATDTEIRVRVPWFAGDGLVGLNMAGASKTWDGFSVTGTSKTRPTFDVPSTPSTLELTMPGPLGPYTLYPHYIWVDFAGHASPSAVDASLNAVVAAVDAVDGATIEGLRWTENRYYVQWSWVDDPTPESYQELKTQLLAQPLVEFVFAHQGDGMRLDSIGQPTDVHATGTMDVPGRDGLAWHFAAQRQVGLEEAWRTWRTGPGLVAAGDEPVRVLVIDTGVVGGDWGDGEELPSSSSGEAVSTTLWQLSSDDRWHSATTFTDPMAETAGAESHGTAVAGIIAAANQGATPLDPDAASAEAMEDAAPGFNGVLAGFTHYDDGAPEVEVHVAAVGLYDSTDGATFDADLAGSVFKALRRGRFGDDPDTSADESFAPDIISISLSSSSVDISKYLVPYLAELRTKSDDPDTTEDESKTSPLLIISASNRPDDAASVQGFVDMLDRAGSTPYFNEGAADHVLFIGGTHGRPRTIGGSGRAPDSRGVFEVDGSGDPMVGSAYGSAVALAAPMDGWNGIQYDGASGTRGHDYDLGDDIGTSLSVPAVAGLAALLKATNPDLTAPQLRHIIAGTGPDISQRWAAGLSGGASEHTMHRLDATAALVQALGRSPDTYVDTNVYVYTLDRGNSGSSTTDPARLNARAVEPSEDPSGGAYLAGDPIEAAVRVNLENFDCWDPADVVVDPRGDVVYVLCKGVSPYDGGLGEVCTADWTVHAFHGSLQAEESEDKWLGCVDLTGDSSPSAELVVGSDGLLLAATALGSELVLEYFDTFHGGLAALPAYGTGRLASYADYIVGAELDGLQRAVLGLTLGDSSEGGDTVARIEPLSLSSREPGAPDSYDFSGDSDTYSLTDVAPASVDDAGVTEHDILALFETHHSGSGSTDVEGIWIAEDLGSGESLEFEDAEWPVAGALDPQIGSTAMWMADYEEALVSAYDTTDTSPLSPDLSCGSPTGSGTDYPVAVEYADNGQFVVAAWQHSSTSGSSRSLADDAVTCDWSSAHSSAYLYDVQAIAVTPTLSILSPRPGTLIDGYRRFVVMVRDPYVDHLELEWWDEDGYLLSTDQCLSTFAVSEPDEDLPVHPGIFDDCQVDGQEFAPAGPGSDAAARYRVTITAVYADGAEGAEVSAWYER